jgi:3-dehydroquinate synthetase
MTLLGGLEAAHRRVIDVRYLGAISPYVYGDGIADEIGSGIRALDERVSRAVVVADERVFALHGQRVADGLTRDGLRTDVHTVATYNPDKSLAAVERLYHAFHDLGVDGRTFVVLLGGNVLTDCAAFACATYLRGVPFALMPSTLLGQVDGSLGGALGVHYLGVTNQVGLRQLPALVWSDPGLLTTLPQAELRAGFAEIVKQAIVSNAGLFERLERMTPGDLDDPRVRAELVWDTVVSKCDLLMRTDDWRLNFGHTLGHALESASGHAVLRHGEAVSIGMVAESRIAYAVGLLSDTDLRRIGGLLDRFGLPTAMPGSVVDALGSVAALRAQILHFLVRDKKVRDGAVRWWLPSGIGAAQRRIVPTAVYLGSIDSLWGEA